MLSESEIKLVYDEIKLYDGADSSSYFSTPYCDTATEAASLLEESPNYLKFG